VQLSGSRQEDGQNKERGKGEGKVEENGMRGRKGGKGKLEDG
jgi:hypothetical protein